MSDEAVLLNAKAGSSLKSWRPCVAM